MAEKKQGHDEDQRKNHANENEQESSGGELGSALSPEEYLAMQESGKMGSYLFPEEDKEKDKEKETEHAPEAQEQAQGNKGKVLTSDGLEYDKETQPEEDKLKKPEDELGMP